MATTLSNAIKRKVKSSVHDARKYGALMVELRMVLGVPTLRMRVPRRKNFVDLSIDDAYSIASKAAVGHSARQKAQRLK